MAYSPETERLIRFAENRQTTSGSPGMVELLMRHQGPQFMPYKGTVECFCGEEVGNDHSWALHVVALLLELEEQR